MWFLLSCVVHIPPEAEGEGWEVRHLTVGEGLSGLTVDDEGALWSVAERPAALVRLRDNHRVLLTLPGEPESVAWTPTGFWIGTEQSTARTEDVLVRVSDHGAILEQRSYTYEGVTPKPNHGLEGICMRGDDVVVAGEDARPGRDAPIAAVPGDTDWLRLHSDTGKVSALACTETHLYAIERHYEVLHLLVAPWSDLSDTTLIPVPEGARGTKVNYEGLALQGGRALLLSDNQGASVDGPTVLLSLELPQN